MNCELCKKDIGDVIVSLPIKKPDGCLNTMACLECAEESSAYCKKHKRPHLGFADDDTTACMICIEEMIARERSKEAYIFNRLKEALPLEDLKYLLEWADLAASITGNSRLTCILRDIVTKALRRQVSIEEIVKQILQTKSVDVILP